MLQQQPGPGLMGPRSWQNLQQDNAERESIRSQIYHMFQNRKSSQQNNSNYLQKLPDFVRRVEQELYRTARSKEEYMDISTLEQRLQLVAKSFTPRPQQANMNMVPGQGQPLPQGPVNQLGMGGPINTGMMSHNQVMGHQGMAPQPGMGYGSGMNQHFQSDTQDMLRSRGMTPVSNMNGMIPSPALPPLSSNSAAGSFPQPMPQQQPPPGMIPNPTNQPPSGFGNQPQLMNNGAPVLIRDQYNRGWNNGPAQAVLGGNSSASAPSGPLPMGGMVPTPMANGNAPSMPQQQLGSNFMPTPGSNMVPVNNAVPLASNGNMIPVNNGAAMTASSPLNINLTINFNKNTVPASNLVPVPSGNMVPMSHGMTAGNNNLQPGLGNFGVANMNAPGVAQLNGFMPGLPDQQASGMTEDHRAQYVAKQQRWLLFLRHCAKCKQEDGECQLKQQCKFGKQLWQHILQCQNPNCDYARCSGSKDLLKHHQKCQSAQCPICGPVKEYVRKTRAPNVAQMPPAGGWNGMYANGMGMYAMAPNSQANLMRTNSQGSVGQKRTHQMMDPYAGNMTGMNPADFFNEQDVPPKRSKPTKEMLAANTGTSLLETFTAEQIRTHIESIRQAAAPHKPPQVDPPPNPNDMCRVCGLTKLLYEPPVVYCCACGMRIKRSQTYWMLLTSEKNDVKGCWCHTCYQESKGDRIQLDALSIKKSDLGKRKNDEEQEEGWVQCDYCESWVHMICGLFNKGRNNQDVHYLCPDCLLTGIESGIRQKIEQRPQAMLEAKELPSCELSHFLQQRLDSQLAKDLQARAQAMDNKGDDKEQAAQVHPQVEPLTVRVVNNVMKKCEVKSRFQETYKSDGYPTEFPYRQRVILLFQNLDGVDVCLFCMYVQEYGADCPAPNQRVVYLSYLDSVKYFRPEVASATISNQALRSFVYHQLLIGYLDWVKQLGFEQMYIWACPPMQGSHLHHKYDLFNQFCKLQGDDYILYCHPPKQKTPRSDRLRNWYLDMLRRAKDEGIVKHISTLWDMFFEGGRDHRSEKCSAVHIPYLEGDYWPERLIPTGEAEIQLAALHDGVRQQGKGSVAAGRKAGAKGKRYGAGPATTDEQLMQRLGEVLGGNMKEDFIVVHLYDVCTFCRKHMHGGETVHRYRSQGPLKAPPAKVFEGLKLEQGPNVPIGPVTSLTICNECFDEEQRRVAAGEGQRLPASITPEQLTSEVLDPDVNRQDPDGDMDNEFFETRQTFLSLCQGNHYQFDTLRRAKHSSMMVLYHLHNPSAPAFSCTCNVCQMEIEMGTGFRCTVCPDFDICKSCRINRPHPHPLQAHATVTNETRERLTPEQQRERALQLQRTMTLLVHSCNCDGNCPSSSCQKVKTLFKHAAQCELKVTKGCNLCKKMWCLLNLHAKSCPNPDCNVPRCRELKELRRRQAQRQEEKRRKAYHKLLRQQFAR